MYKRLFYEDIKKLNWGQTFWENVCGKYIKFFVITEPIENNNKLQWKAENVKSGEFINFFITKGLEHYGPKIYQEIKKEV